MFKITPVLDKDKQKALADAVGTIFRADLFAYEMIDDETGDLMGFSQFDLGAGTGELVDLKEAPGRCDFEAMFIMGRSTMNFIDLHGNHKCVATENTTSERMLKCLGFRRQEDGTYFCDMTGMFDGHCSGKPVDLNN